MATTKFKPTIDINMVNSVGFSVLHQRELDDF